MICPRCGFVDKNIDIPSITRNRHILGICKNCGIKVEAIPTSRRFENSQYNTVLEGEKREEILVKVYLKHENGYTDKKRPQTDDIDREIYDKKDNLLFFMEIKERTNSLNAYADTMFPFSKINTAKHLIKETGLPVFIVLKFVDSWARLEIKSETEYRRGDKPFAPRYRPQQRTKQRQIPVLISVESLEILQWGAKNIEIK